MITLQPLVEIKDTRMLQTLLEQAPRYFRLLTGGPAPPSAATELLGALPPGKQRADKFVLGVFDGRVAVGCTDLIRGLPTKTTAFIGLLLIAEQYEGRGFGAEAFRRICEFVSSWEECTILRLGILEANVRALGFWSRLGFRRVDERAALARNALSPSVMLYERPLVISHHDRQAPNR